MLIIGAKGLAKQILSSLDESVYGEIVFFDDISSDIADSLYDRFRVIKSLDEAKKYFKEVSDKFVIGVGDVKVRAHLAEKFKSIGGKLESFISSSSTVSKFEVSIGQGVVILQKSLIESSVNIGEGSLVNVNCIVTHDSKIGKYCELSPGVIICGECKISDYSSLGAGAVVLPRITIGKGAVIGAGAVVTEDISEEQTVIGIPAKPKH